jgi:hypothetical protein
LVKNRDRRFKMKILRLIYKCLHELFGPPMSLPTGIDTHKWESKIEIMRLF